MLAAVRSLLFYAYFFVTAPSACLPLLLVRILLAPWDRQGHCVHTLTRWLAYHYIAMNPAWKLSFENVQLLRRHENFLLVANHQSLMDILVLARLHARYKWVAKIQLWKVFALGSAENNSVVLG